MKKLIIAVVCSSVMLSAGSALAADGTLNFTGEIIDEACKIDIGADNTMAVVLGKVAKSSFSGVGSKSSQTKFMLEMSNCPETLTSATFKFSGIGYSGDDSVLGLTKETGSATGVAIELTDSTQTRVPLFTASASVPLSSGVNKIPFYASYIQMDENVTSGPANSVAQFTLNYN